MTGPLIVLAILTAIGGLLNLPFLTKSLADINENHSTGVWLGLESWLEHSVLAFEYTEEGIIHLPHTPIVLSLEVALTSTLLAVLALTAAFLVYRRRPESATDRDPLQRTPIWWFAVLPLNTFVMDWLRPLFNRLSKWLAFKLDWAFWHDFVHENIIRDMFVSFADFLSNIIDKDS